LKTKRWIPEPLYSQVKALVPIPTVDALIVNDNRLLLMLRKNRPAMGEWFTPGGRILLGEKIEDAIRRVAKGETGLNPVNIEVKGAMSHIWPNMQTVTVFCRVDVEKGRVKMDDQHSAYKWITEVTEDLHPYLKEMISKAEIFP